jgi:xylulokinase
MVKHSEKILAVDVGTTSIKSAVVDLDCFEALSTSSTKAVVEYPKKGWAEKDPDTLWSSVLDVMKESLEDHNVSAVIFGAHMAGVLPVDKDGNPLRKIIIWLDERAEGLPEDLWSGIFKIQGYSVFKLLRFLRITGGAPSKTGKDAISKIIWVKENERDVFEKTYKILDVKGFLINRATGSFITSPDEAHLSWLADTRDGRIRWAKTLLKDYGLQEGLFPEIKNSTEIGGYLKESVAKEIGIDPLPVIVGSGDVCATAVGSGAVKPEELHIYIGTSNWVAGHVVRRKTDVFHYIGSLMSAIPNRYLLIAEQEVAGGALEWAMKLVGIEGDYNLVERLAERGKVGKLIFMPWFFGERAPVDDPFIRGGLVNVGLDDGREEVLRAMMEGVALNIKWAYPYMERMTRTQEAVRLVGGGALFDLWSQIIADAIKRPVKRLKNPDQSGLRGLAVMADVGLGRENFETAVSRFQIERVFKPGENAVVYDRMIKIYSELYRKLRKIYRELNKVK